MLTCVECASEEVTRCRSERCAVSIVPFLTRSKAQKLQAGQKVSELESHCG